MFRLMAKVYVTTVQTGKGPGPRSDPFGVCAGTCVETPSLHPPPVTNRTAQVYPSCTDQRVEKETRNVTTEEVVAVGHGRIARRRTACRLGSDAYRGNLQRLLLSGHVSAVLSRPAGCKR